MNNTEKEEITVFCNTVFKNGNLEHISNNTKRRVSDSNCPNCSGNCNHCSICKELGIYVCGTNKSSHREGKTFGQPGDIVHLSQSELRANLRYCLETGEMEESTTRPEFIFNPNDPIIKKRGFIDARKMNEEVGE